MPEIPSEVLMKQVQKIRVRRGWSQQELADRLDALGLPMDRTILAKLESGKRGVSVDEALTLAVALGVSPTSLLLPRDDSGKVRITPGKEVGTWDALLWFRGALPLHAALLIESAMESFESTYPAGSTITRDEYDAWQAGREWNDPDHRDQFIADSRVFVEEVPDSEAESNRRYPTLRSIWVKAGMAMRSAADPERISDLVERLEDLQADVKSELRRARRELASYEQQDGNRNTSGERA